MQQVPPRRGRVPWLRRQEASEVAPPGRVTSRNRTRKTTTTAKAKKPEDSNVILQSKITVALKRAVQVAADLYAAPMIPVVHLRDDVSEAVQSACYCKSTAYMYLPLLRLTPTLGHYLHQTRPPKSERVELWCRFHAEKGLSLRGISEEVTLDKDLRGLDLAVYSIMCLMLIDATAMKAVAHRGGIKQLYERNVAMQPTLKYFMILGVLASSTSPPEDYLVTTPELDFLEKVYGKGDYPTVLCPPFLFLIVSQINRLRLQTTQPRELHDPDSPSAQALLSKILGFNPDEWARLYPDSYQELFLLARIYHAAVALYCISALRSLFPTGFLYNLLMLRAAQADCLFGLLRVAIQSPKTQPCLMWILNVAGVEAATRSLSDRLFVEEALDELSRGLGTGYPLVARGAIHRLWDSGKTEWDDCYDRPYAFLS
ncbi:C6 finger domain protein [Apiospora saccharicola]